MLVIDHTIHICQDWVHYFGKIGIHAHLVLNFKENYKI